MRGRLIFAFGFLVCAGGTVDAKPVEYSAEYTSCMQTAGTDADHIDSCTSAELARQDGKLNQYYKMLSTSLSPNRKDLLQKSERSWIQFRDNECAFQGSRLIGGPLGIEARAQASFKAECTLKQTYLRATELLDDYASGTSDSPKK